VTTSDCALAQAQDVAQGLIGGAVRVRHLMSGGRNSRIFRVDSGECAYALKQYPSREGDPRDRLATEVGALRLMEHHRLDVVPRVMGVDPDRGYALLSWIEGAEVFEPTEIDVDAAVAFLSAIHALRHTAWAADQPLASEACLSGAELERQISARLGRLQEVSEGEPDLADFFEHAVLPRRRRLVAEAKSKMAAAALDFVAELPEERRSLVPSDFGFHNSLRRSDGSLAFVDFEYFGWDDPVKLTADILLHPGRALTLPQRRRFRRLAVGLYGDHDSVFPARLAALLPLFGLRWVLILLNEFVPERWRRRIQAGATEDWAEAKRRQLAQARQFIASLDQKVEA
jgi:hypothetical protein